MEEISTSFAVDDFNEDCLLEIFSYLSLNDMMQVKNVCKKWQQISEQWFKKVQSIRFETKLYGNWTWRLHANNFMRELATGSDIKQLIPILKSFGQNIKHYTINYCTTNSKKTLQREQQSFQLIPTLCENVIDVNIHSQTYSTWDLGVMANHWRQLQKFDFDCFSKSLAKNFCELLRSNHELKSLTLKYSINNPCPPGDKFFIHLPRKVQRIDVDFAMNDEIKLRYFVSASKNFESLTSLRLSNLINMTDAVGNAIGSIKSLEHLALEGIHYSESRRTFVPLTKLENLKSFEVTESYGLEQNDIIKIINGCPQLEQVGIFTETLTDKGLKVISRLEKLKLLGINAEFMKINSVINLVDKLEVFICETSEMKNDDAIKLLKRATNLWYLEFSDCPNLTEEVIKVAGDVANERKKNILHMLREGYDVDVGDVDTPYFRCYRDLKTFPLERLPNYIQVYLREYHPYR